MKKLYPLLITLALLSATVAPAQNEKPLKRSKKDLEFMQHLEGVSDNDLWIMRERISEKRQSQLVTGAVFMGWGWSGVIVGGISLMSDNEDIKSAAGTYIGLGLVGVIIGAAWTGSAIKNKKRDLWIEKELWIRDEKVTFKASPTKVAFTFGS